MRPAGILIISQHNNAAHTNAQDQDNLVTGPG